MYFVLKKWKHVSIGHGLSNEGHNSEPHNEY